MRRLLLILSLLIGNLFSVAQVDHMRGMWDEFEETDSNYISSNGILDSRNGYKLSAHGQIRFLFAFVELEYSDPLMDPSPGTTEWPAGQLPAWKDNLFDYNTPIGLSNCSITKYFQMASSNNHTVIGDYLVAPGNGGVFKVPTVNGSVKPPHDIINAINQQLGYSFSTAHGFSSFNDFDSWTTTNYGEEKLNTGNNKWDFVVFIVRNSIKPDNTTGCCNSIDDSLLGHQADQFAVVCTHGNNPTQIIRHEYHTRCWV